MENGDDNFSGAMIVGLLAGFAAGPIAGIVLGTGWAVLVIWGITVLVITGLYVYHRKFEPQDTRVIRQAKEAENLRQYEADKADKAAAAADLAKSKVITGAGWLIETGTSVQVNRSFKSGRLIAFVNNTGEDDACLVVTAHGCTIEGTRFARLHATSSILPPGRREMLTLTCLPIGPAHSTEWDVNRSAF